MANEQNLKKFSSTYQPPNENKRVPKWKTRFKNMLNDPESLKAFEKQIKNGNVRAWQVLLERVHGKVKDRVEHSGSIETTNINEVIEDLRKSLNDK